jgi:uncharacterized ion transporter superfamily protein YfcC
MTIVHTIENFILTTHFIYSYCTTIHDDQTKRTKKIKNKNRTEKRDKESQLEKYFMKFHKK